jgi:hypothetical protein
VVVAEGEGSKYLSLLVRPCYSRLCLSLFAADAV